MDQFAWATGLFEGEGSAVVSGNSLRLTLPSTDKDVLDRLQRALGGKVYGPYATGRNKLGKKSMYRWVHFGTPAREIASSMYGQLSERRQAQIDACFEKLRKTVEERSTPRPCRICGTMFIPPNPRYASRTFYCGQPCKRRVSNGYVVAQLPRTRFTART